MLYSLCSRSESFRAKQLLQYCISFDNKHIMCIIKNNLSECVTTSLTQTFNFSIISNDRESYWERSLGFLIIGMIGTVANAFVILILGSSAKIRQKLVNTLIIHQSFVDFLASVALMGTAHLNGYDPHGLERVHAKVYCFFVMGKWPLWLPIFTSSFSLMFLNIERYISIVYPNFHHTQVTLKKVLFCLPIVWVLGLFEVFLIGSGVVSVNGTCNRGPSNYHFQVFWLTMNSYIVLHFFLPVLLVLILFGHMILRLRINMEYKYDDARSRKRDNIMEKAKQNIFKTMLLITVCYAICYAFNCIYIVFFLRGVVNLTGKLLILFNVKEWRILISCFFWTYWTHPRLT